MKKVLFYMDKDSIGTKGDSTDYVRNGMMSQSDDFKVDLSTEADPRLAKDYDVVFCRFDIPIKREFLENLSDLDDGNRLFINPPMSKIKYHTKDYLKNFVGMDLIPETIISSDHKELAYFAKEYGKDIISKPLDLNGGEGIEKLNPVNMSTSELEELAYNLTDKGTKQMIFQGYIDGVENYGDKRINVLFYEPVSAALRLPSDGSYICNLKAGGRDVATDITDRDREIITAIRPFLEEHRIVWAGVDIIGPYLCEINVSGPGMLVEADILNKDTKGLDFLMNNLKNYKP